MGRSSDAKDGSLARCALSFAPAGRANGADSSSRSLTDDAGQLVTVGRVGRPHGLDGSFVVENASEEPERLAPGATVLIGGEPAEIVGRKRAGGRLVIRLDRPATRGAELQVRRSDLPPPGPDSYYVFQLVGLQVEEAGGPVLGTVTDVVPGIANDVLELDSGLALPLVEACIQEVDLERRRILVTPGFISHD